MNKRLVFWIGASLAAALGALGIFVGFGLSTKPSFLISVSMSIAITVLQLGAAWYFLANLRNFKTGLKISYTVLAISVLFVAFAQLQLPFLSYFQLWDTAWAANGYLLLPYLISTVGLLVGVRKLARLLNLRGPLRSLWVVLIASLVVAGLSTLIPYPYVAHPGMADAIYAGLLTFTFVCTAAAAFSAWQVRNIIGLRYVPAVHWLALALSVYALEALHEFIIIHLLPASNWYIDLGVSIWPLIITAGLFLAAGLAFRKLDRDL